MNYIKNKNEIIITDLSNFNIVQILDCGQIFRYTIDGNIAKVYSKNKFALIVTETNRVVIKTDDVDYFENFFDLSTNYSKIKTTLKWHQNSKTVQQKLIIMSY